MKNNRLGLTLGTFAAIVNGIWAILVALNFAGRLMDFCYKMHFMVVSPYGTMPFNLGRAIGLVMLAFVIGFIVGSVLEYLWKYFGKNA